MEEEEMGSAPKCRFVLPGTHERRKDERVWRDDGDELIDGIG
jgi:hypothetical protein